jgi:hypothetical protein
MFHVIILHEGFHDRTSSISYISGGQTADRDLPVDRGQLFGQLRPLFFKIVYLKHN